MQVCWDCYSFWVLGRLSHGLWSAKSTYSSNTFTICWPFAVPTLSLQAVLLPGGTHSHSRGIASPLKGEGQNCTGPSSEEKPCNEQRRSCVRVVCSHRWVQVRGCCSAGFPNILQDSELGFKVRMCTASKHQIPQEALLKHFQRTGFQNARSSKKQGSATNRIETQRCKTAKDYSCNLLEKEGGFLKQIVSKDQSFQTEATHTRLSEMASSYSQAFERQRSEEDKRDLRGQGCKLLKQKVSQEQSS